MDSPPVVVSADAMLSLAKKWRALGDRETDRCHRTGKWFSNMTEEEKTEFCEAQLKSIVYYECANELKLLVEREVANG